MHSHINKCSRVSIGILLILCWLIPRPIWASDDTHIHRHIIVAADNAGTKGWIFSSQTGQAVFEALTKNYPSVDVPGKLLRSEDYLSIVKFDIGSSDTSLETDYVKEALPNDVPCLKVASSIGPLSDSESFAKLWAEAAKSNPPRDGDGFSLLSIAKPYILQGVSSLASQAHIDNQKVSRTFLIMLTDHHYNGNDFYDESKGWIQTESRRKVSTDSVSSFCRRVEQDYYIRHIETRQIKEHTKQYLEVYEYQPLQQHFTLPAALAYPAKAKAHRVWGDKYEIQFTIGTQGNTHFTIDRVDISLCQTSGNQVPHTSIHDVTRDVAHTLNIERKDRNKYNAIGLDAWLTINDGFYGFTQMSPEAEAPIFLGRDGLKVQVEIEYEEDSHIFGVIPMPDWIWWFYHEDQYKGALMMSFLILFIVLLGLALWIWKAQRYHPDPSQMILR